MKSFLSSKKTKAIAVVLSVMVVLCSVISVSGAAGDTSEVAPEVYNAWYDYFDVTKAGIETNTQKGPWYYEYKLDKTLTEWKQMKRFDGNSWFIEVSDFNRSTRIDRYNKMLIDNKVVNSAGLIPNGALAYGFVVPKSGYILFNSSTVSITDNTN